MINRLHFDELSEFLEWWEQMNPEDQLDMNEALTVFFNQDTYLTTENIWAC